MPIPRRGITPSNAEDMLNAVGRVPLDHRDLAVESIMHPGNPNTRRIA